VDDGVLRPRTIESLHRAHAAGLHVVVVTGRMFQSVRRALGPAQLGDPVVCYQGAVVADGQGTWLRHVPIELELAREALRFAAAEGYRPNVYVADELYVARHTAASEAYASFQHLEVHAVGPLLDWLQEPPTKLVAVGDPVELDALEALLVAQFDGRMYISKSLPYFLEFASPDVTKGSGLAFVAEHMGFSQERTVGFGDGENDLPLLEWTGYAVAVENADDRVLTVADFVCPPCDEEGVAQVIEAYLAR